MAYPNVEPGFETFFEPTRIWLFGKPFPSLIYNRDSMGAVLGSNPPGTDATHANEFVNYTANPIANDAGLANQLGMPPRRVERALRRHVPGVPAGNNNNPPAVAPVPPIFARIYSFSFEGHYYK